MAEIKFWIENLDKLNGFPYNQPVSLESTHFDDMLTGDASSEGLYLACLKGKEGTLLSRKFYPEEKKSSSTKREFTVFQQFYTSEDSWRY